MRQYRKKKSSPRISKITWHFCLFLLFSLSPIFTNIVFDNHIARAAQVTLSWDENTDPDIADYKVFSRLVDQDYDYSSPAWAGAETTCTITDLLDSKAYCFVAKTYNIYGYYSTNSNEVCYYNPGDRDGDDDMSEIEEILGTDDEFEENEQSAASVSATADSDQMSEDYSEEILGTDDEFEEDEQSAASVSATSFINHLPDQPVLYSPWNGILGLTLTPELITGPFSDSNFNDMHAETRWQIGIGSTSPSNFLVFDKISRLYLTFFIVPELVLNADTAYYWRVKFYDSNGGKSVWSESYSFITNTSAYTDDTDSDGISDDQAFHPGYDYNVDLDNDGNPDISQNDIKCLNTSTNNQIGIKIPDDDTSILSLDSIKIKWFDSYSSIIMPNPAVIRGELLSGVICFRLEVKNPGDTARVVFYFSEKLPVGAEWYKNNISYGWEPYEYAFFDDTNHSVTLELMDGGYGDEDGVTNGVIVDTGGIIVIPPHVSNVAADDKQTENAPAGGAGGCFISAALPLSSEGG